MSTTTTSISKRPYGKNGVELSVLGFGAIIIMDEEQTLGHRIVGEAVERGINYFDVAPSYGDGAAQAALGPALEPYRKDVFLACKTGRRDRAGAEAELKESLEVMRTDYFDLYQLHAITSVEQDVDAVFEKNGLMDMLIEAKASGKVRHLGFSAHSEEAALAALDRYDFDSVLIAVNFATWHKNEYPWSVMDAAKEKGASILALKSMAKQHWTDGHPLRETYTKPWYEPLADPEMMELALRWTLSQPVTAAIPPGEIPLWQEALEIAARFEPITEDEEEKLRTYAQTLNPIFPNQ
jgi:aryl-alcohol dehydrogenase-like predicted oxidoreductase